MSSVSQSRHHVAGRARAEQADRPGDPRQIVGQHGLAEQRFRAAGLQPVGDLDHLALGAERSGADEHRDLRAGVEHLGGAAQIGFVRDRPAAAR